LLQYDYHQGVQLIVKDLNQLYKQEPALYQFSFEQKGFQWVDYGDRENSVIAFQRHGERKEDLLIIICNFTPSVRQHYRIGVPYRGQWKEYFNSDEKKYGGSGVHNHGLLMTSPVKYHQRDYSVSLTLPPLGMVILKLEREVNQFELEDIST
jgi:1,4-alpha-glucan branching enzyme